MDSFGFLLPRRYLEATLLPLRPQFPVTFCFFSHELKKTTVNMLTASLSAPVWHKVQKATESALIFGNKYWKVSVSDGSS